MVGLRLLYSRGAFCHPMKMSISFVFEMTGSILIKKRKKKEMTGSINPALGGAI